MNRKYRYNSYLLRLWQIPDGEKPTWRFSLEDTQSREQRGFQELEALVAFLKSIIETEPSPQKDR